MDQCIFNGCFDPFHLFIYFSQGRNKLKAYFHSPYVVNILVFVQTSFVMYFNFFVFVSSRLPFSTKFLLAAVTQAVHNLVDISNGGGKCGERWLTFCGLFKFCSKVKLVLVLRYLDSYMVFMWFFFYFLCECVCVFSFDENDNQTTIFTEICRGVFLYFVYVFVFECNAFFYLHFVFFLLVKYIVLYIHWIVMLSSLRLVFFLLPLQK